MKRFFCTLFCMVAFSGAAQATTWVAEVKGMVCAFCAQGIEASLRENPEVAEVKVDLDASTVTVKTAQGKDFSEAVLRRTITDAGFDVGAVRVQK
jgi:copper chaperone CopZ